MKAYKAKTQAHTDDDPDDGEAFPLSYNIIGRHYWYDEIEMYPVTDEQVAVASPDGPIYWPMKVFTDI